MREGVFMIRRTKIVCTIGQSTVEDGIETSMNRLVEAGMDVVRLNMSYAGGKYGYGLPGGVIEWARSIGYRLENRTIAVMADLQGIKFRIRNLPEGAVDLALDEEIHLMPAADYTQAPGTLPIPDELFPQIAPYMAENDHLKVYFGDGDIIINIVRIDDDGPKAKVVIGGKLKDGKGVTLQGVDLNIADCLTEKDREDLRWLAKTGGATFIAVSFVQDKNDVIRVKRFLQEECGLTQELMPPIISKIETKRACENIDEILDESYGIMLARGDLGLQIGPERVTVVQKDVIKRCQVRGHPVITATQMLASMETKLEPQRAEASDIFNAILDGTDALMLSGETSAGRYPVQAVEMMARIAYHAEEYRERRDRDEEGVLLNRFNQLHLAASKRKRAPERVHANLITHAAASFTAVSDLKVRAIVTPTTSGKTTRYISRYRPDCMIIAAAHKLEVARRLALSYGVIPLYIRQGPTDSVEQIFAISIRRAVRRNLLSVGDVVIFSGGYPMWTAGTTNLLKIHVVEQEEVERDGHGRLF